MLVNEWSLYRLTSKCYKHSKPGTSCLYVQVGSLAEGKAFLSGATYGIVWAFSDSQ